MKRIKVISSYFLPFENANAFAIGKKILNLSLEKYDIEILTYNFDGVLKKSKFWNKQNKNIKKVYIANIKSNFLKRILCAIKKGMNCKNQTDIIISYFHLSEVAYLIFLLQKRDKCPWIAIYSDPPAHMSPFNSKRIFGHLREKITEVFTSYIPTKITMKYATKLIFNDVWQAKFILGEKYEKYKDKVQIIQMGATFNTDSIKAKNEDIIILRYLGSLYNQRNAVEFIKAADKFLEDNQENKKRVKIEFYGDIDSHETRKAYKEIKNKKNIEFFNNVSYEKSIELIKSSDILLVIDANLKGEKIYPYTPSKILEYIGAKKPIFAVSMDKSPTHDICVETKNWWANFDEEEIIKQLQLCIMNYKKHNYDFQIIEKYHETTKNKEFEILIDNLLEQ